MCCLVHPSVPAKSVKELIALARARPGDLVYSVNSYAGGQHLSGELLKQAARIDMKPVVFQGGAPSAMPFWAGTQHSDFDRRARCCSMFHQASCGPWL